MEIEFSQNQKRVWYCTKINFQCYDMKDGSKIMKSTINSINQFLMDLDKPKEKIKITERVKGLK